MQNNDLRAQPNRLGGVMCHVDEGNFDSLLGHDNLVEKAGARLCVDGRKRFIEEDYRWIGSQGPREGRPLLFSTGHVLWIPLAYMFDLQETHHFSRPFQTRCTRRTTVLDPVGDILLSGHVRKQSVVLKDISDAPLLDRQVGACFRIEVDHLTDIYSPRVGGDDTGDRA